MQHNEENYQESNDEEAAPSPLKIVLQQTMKNLFSMLTNFGDEPLEEPYVESEIPSIQYDENESEKVDILNCKHIFHKDCLLKWYDKNRSYPTCPLCRSKM